MASTLLVPAHRRGANAGRPRCDVHQGRRANSVALLSDLPSHRRDRPDVADDLPTGAAVGPRDQDPRRRTARCRRGTSTGRSASRSSRTIRRSRDDEIATIAAGSMPARRAATRPTCRRCRSSRARRRWQIGEPDLIINFPKYKVPGGRSRPLRRSPDRHPDPRRSLHQGDPDPFGDAEVAQGRAPRAVLLRVDQPKTASMTDEGGQFLVEYASGKNAEVYPEGSGVLLKTGPAGARQLSPALDRRGDRRGSRARHQALSEGLRAEATSAGRASSRSRPRRSTSRRAWFREATATRSSTSRRGCIAFQPHMHNLGSRQCLELIYPTSGTRTTTEMINCANFNNNWHLTYNYTDDAQPLLPAGTILHNIPWHDNTKANPRATRSRRTGSATASARSTRWASSGSAGSSSAKTNTRRSWLSAKRSSARRRPTSASSSNSSSSYGRTSGVYFAPLFRSSRSCASPSRRGRERSRAEYTNNFRYNIGQDIQPIFEGWSHAADGSINMHFGYLNRNYVETPTIPVGPNNIIEPGGPDRGQPTFFYPRTNRNLFTVNVPEGWAGEARRHLDRDRQRQDAEGIRLAQARMGNRSGRRRGRRRRQHQPRAHREQATQRRRWTRSRR